MKRFLNLKLIKRLVRAHQYHTTRIRSFKNTSILCCRTIIHSIFALNTARRCLLAGSRWLLVSSLSLFVFYGFYAKLGVLSSVISSAASLMVLSKIAKGEIIQSGYLKKHLGKFNKLFIIYSRRSN